MIVVTYSATTIDVDFSSLPKKPKDSNTSAFKRDAIIAVHHIITDVQEYVEVDTLDYRGANYWHVSSDANPCCLQIASVNGVAPTSNTHLYSLLKALII